MTLGWPVVLHLFVRNGRLVFEIRDARDAQVRV